MAGRERSRARPSPRIVARRRPGRPPHWAAGRVQRRRRQALRSRLHRVYAKQSRDHEHKSAAAGAKTFIQVRSEAESKGCRKKTERVRTGRDGLRRRLRLRRTRDARVHVGRGVLEVAGDALLLAASLALAQSLIRGLHAHAHKHMHPHSATRFLVLATSPPPSSSEPRR